MNDDGWWCNRGRNHQNALKLQYFVRYTVLLLFCLLRASSTSVSFHLLFYNQKKAISQLNSTSCYGRTQTTKRTSDEQPKESFLQRSEWLKDVISGWVPLFHFFETWFLLLLESLLFFLYFLCNLKNQDNRKMGHLLLSLPKRTDYYFFNTDFLSLSLSILLLGINESNVTVIVRLKHFYYFLLLLSMCWTFFLLKRFQVSLLHHVYAVCMLQQSLFLGWVFYGLGQHSWWILHASHSTLLILEQHPQHHRR
jgi:hypothetical protein